MRCAASTAIPRIRTRLSRVPVVAHRCGPRLPLPPLCLSVQGCRVRLYSIGKVLGQGGFGITYLGSDTGLKRAVAIKEFFPQVQGCSRYGTTVQPGGMITPVGLSAREEQVSRRGSKAGPVPTPEHRQGLLALRGEQHRLHGDGVPQGEDAPEDRRGRWSPRRKGCRRIHRANCARH